MCIRDSNYASHVAAINNFVSAGIPVILPTGNNFNYLNIDDPACITGALAISSIDDKGRLALYANYSPRVDFAANGNLNVAIANNGFKQDFGTSLSVGVFAASWLAVSNKKGLSYKDEYNLFKSTAKPYTNIMVKANVNGIDLNGALK